MHFEIFTVIIVYYTIIIIKRRSKRSLAEVLKFIVIKSSEVLEVRMDFVKAFGKVQEYLRIDFYVSV